MTASWVKENALQLWDIRNCHKNLYNLPILTNTESRQLCDSISLSSTGSSDSIEVSDPKKRGEYLYACKFFASNHQHKAFDDKQYTSEKNPNDFSTIIACGSGTQSVHLIDYEQSPNNQHINALHCKSPLYCLDTMYASSLIACGSMKKFLTVMTTTEHADPI